MEKINVIGLQTRVFVLRKPWKQHMLIPTNWPIKRYSDSKYVIDDYESAKRICVKLVKGYDTTDLTTADSEAEKAKRRKFSKKRLADYEPDISKRADKRINNVDEPSNSIIQSSHNANTK